MATRYGLDPAMLAGRILRPLLQYLDARVPGLWSPAAERLVLGTAMQESHLRYLKQIQGPAIGICQMERATWQDLRRWLARRHVLRHAIDDWAIGEPDADEMEGNLYYALAMCRAHYRRVPAALPPANLPGQLATYWKAHYNTAAGKGRVADAMPHFVKADAVFKDIDMKQAQETAS